MDTVNRNQHRVLLQGYGYVAAKVERLKPRYPVELEASQYLPQKCRFLVPTCLRKLAETSSQITTIKKTRKET